MKKKFKTIFQVINIHGGEDNDCGGLERSSAGEVPWLDAFCAIKSKQTE